VANTSAHTASTRPFAGNPTRRTGARRRMAGELARYLGAVSILIVGAIHAQQYYDAYFRVVPTIGTLFLLSFIGAGVVGAVLFAPVRLLGERLGDLILSFAALGAIGIALGTLVSLLISEYMPLFGFMESGYRLAIVLTLVFDGLTTVFLGFFLLTVGPQLITAITTERRTR
jgi:MFS family permease